MVRVISAQRQIAPHIPQPLYTHRAPSTADLTFLIQATHATVPRFIRGMHLLHDVFPENAGELRLRAAQARGEQNDISVESRAVWECEACGCEARDAFGCRV